MIDRDDLGDSELSFGGASDLATAGGCRPHCLSHWTVVLVVSGAPVARLSTYELPLAPREALWLRPGMVHSFEAQGPTCRVVKIHARTELVERVASLFSHTQSAPEASMDPLVVTTSQALVRTAVEMAALESSAPVRDEATAYLLARIWECHLAPDEPVSIRVPGDAHPIVKRAVRVLAESDNRFTPAELSRALRVSYNYLARRFKKDMGMTLVEYRNRRCLAEVLRNRSSDANLLSVAIDAGFGSYAQFYRVFRQHLGVNPREYFQSQSA